MLLWHTYALAAPVELSVQVEQPPPASGTPSGHGAAEAMLGLTVTPAAASNIAKTIRFMFKTPKSIGCQSENYHVRWQRIDRTGPMPSKFIRTEYAKEWIHFSPIAAVARPTPPDNHSKLIDHHLLEP